MRLSRAAKWTLLLLVVTGSVGLKVEVLSRLPGSGEVRENAVAQFLTRHGFLVSAPVPNDEPAVFQGTADACALKVYVVSPQGWHRDLISQLNPEADRTFFVYDGQEYAEQPVWKTWADFQWWRFNRYFGGYVPIHPVLGVAEEHLCPGELLPWQEIARIATK